MLDESTTETLRPLLLGIDYYRKLDDAPRVAADMYGYIFRELVKLSNRGYRSSKQHVMLQ
jgi:hypothetical protein